MKYCLYSLFTLCIGCVSQPNQVENKAHWTEEPWIKNRTYMVPYSDGELTLSAEEISNSDSPDYVVAFDKARNMNREGLARVFQISAEAQWDGAGGTQHHSSLRQLLLLWGDYHFSSVLAEQPKNVREHIGSSLSSHDSDVLQTLFPRTYRTSKD